MIVVRRCQSRIMESIFSVASRRTNRARTRSPRFHQRARNHHPSNVVIIAVEKMGFSRRSREAEPEVRIHSPPAESRTNLATYANPRECRGCQPRHAGQKFLGRPVIGPRLCALRMSAAKNSRKHIDTRSPAAVTSAGTAGEARRTSWFIDPARYGAARQWRPTPRRARAQHSETSVSLRQCSVAM